MVNVRVMRRIGQAVICLLSVLHFSGSAASAASCPVEKITSGPYRQGRSLLRCRIVFGITLVNPMRRLSIYTRALADGLQTTGSEYETSLAAQRLEAPPRTPLSIVVRDTP